MEPSLQHTHRLYASLRTSSGVAGPQQQRQAWASTDIGLSKSAACWDAISGGLGRQSQSPTNQRPQTQAFHYPVLVHVCSIKTSFPGKRLAHNAAWRGGSVASGAQFGPNLANVFDIAAGGTTQNHNKQQQRSRRERRATSRIEEGEQVRQTIKPRRRTALAATTLRPFLRALGKRQPDSPGATNRQPESATNNNQLNRTACATLASHRPNT